MSQESEKIKVNDRRIRFDDESQEVPPESEAKKIERKKMAKDYEQAAKQETTNLPKVNFTTFVLSLSSSALMHLGEVPEPESGQVNVNMAMAKHTIDVLAMLEEKTRGNLTPQEDRLLKDVLFEVRMKFVQKAK
ncbi:DUF1844 domain-containing protein [Desulfohalobiaceae bacterium Ax17]|jgi:hypothetical protein|uniref:DUF1844 domain-containing protein n=1 Tax=Desulfovulcanus ferrireducens TaxID=2831190 RepID=UPI003369E260|nr:DUF1844 domain-containing protein [Desulfovulcanus ferrireducens]